MDKRKSLLNVFVSVVAKLILIISGIVVRRLLIRYCGNVANGLNDLFLSILGFFAIAELGVGSAVAFCMYRPIVAGEKEKVASLYHLLRKAYLVIGCVIFLGGLCLLPNLYWFARDYQQINVNLQGTFVLMLISVVITYLYGAETTLINAYKNNYITTAITSLGQLLQMSCQIVVLVCTGSFSWYLVCRIVAAIVQWATLKVITKVRHGDILVLQCKLDRETVRDVVKNVRALFMHRIGGFLVNTIDSVVISSFVGVVVLGAYSNYVTIMNAVGNLLRLGFCSLTSVIGHLYAENGKTTTEEYFARFHLMNFALGVIFYLGYYAIVDNLVALLFSEELLLTKSISMTITLNGFVQFLRQTVLVFRDSTGTFFYDRWKPLFEGLSNLILSVLLVNMIGVTGVIVATIITNLLICHVVEPYVLYRYAFDQSPRRYYLKNYSMILAFALALLMMDRFMVQLDTPWTQLLANGCISVLISLGACVIILLQNATMISKMLFRNGKV